MIYIILGDSFTFPEGDAATNRVYTYAKGFMENGVSAHVVAFRDDYLKNHTGEIEGIRYYHPFARTERSSRFMVRRWQKIVKYYNTLRLFSKLRKEGEIRQIIVYSTRFRTHLFAWILKRLYKAVLVKECSEHPLRLHQKNGFTRIAGLMKFRIETLLCDAVFCISEYLMTFTGDHACGKPRLFKVPSTVDAGRFGNDFPRPVKESYICYCGSLTMQKDGVDILIKAFAEIAEGFPDLLLILVGKADTPEDEALLRQLVSDLNLSDRVIFTGKLPRNEIPAYTCNAEMLVLARPNSMVADAGFPSKLTEYLATGKPVVVTEVGEIPTYLSDGVNAFVAEADSHMAFADKMKYVLGNYDLASDVGTKGKELALTVFNYSYQAKRIIQFIEPIG